MADNFDSGVTMLKPATNNPATRPALTDALVASVKAKACLLYTSPSAKQVAAMEEQLPSPPDGTRVTLRIRFVQVMILDRDGLLHSDTAFGSDE